MAGHHHQRPAVTPTAMALSSGPFLAEAPASNTGDAHGMRHPRDTLRLLEAGQSLQAQSRGIAVSLRQEIAAITQGHAQLILRWQRQLCTQRQAAATAPSFSYPVRYDNRGYGTLYVASDPTNPDLPALPLTLAHLLAEICGLLLYSIEQSALLHALYQHLEPQPIEALTQREHEILTLMCRGHRREEIAHALSIAPRTLAKHYQHIYAKLGVHDERDALLVAFREGLASFIE